jgi:hypothetical protein
LAQRPEQDFVVGGDGAQLRNFPIGLSDVGLKVGPKCRDLRAQLDPECFEDWVEIINSLWK